MALGGGMRKREREGDKKTPTRTYSKKQEDYGYSLDAQEEQIIK